MARKLRVYHTVEQSEEYVKMTRPLRSEEYVKMKGPLKSVAKSEQLKEHLRQKILSETYVAGEQLPSVRKMAKEYSVSMATVGKAISNLATEGLLYTDHGRGVFVSPDIGKVKPSESGRLRIGLACLDSYTSFDDGGRHSSISGWVSGIEEGLRARHHSLNLFVYHKGHFWGDGQNRLREEILSGHIDGLIIKGPIQTGDVDALNEEGIPFVLVENVVQGRNTASIIPDMEYGCRLLLSHVRDIGHRRIGLITYTCGQISERMTESFESISKEMNLIIASDGIIRIENDEGTPDYATYDAAIKQFFYMEPMPPAVILSDEIIANRVIKECLIRGIGVPDKLAFVCFTDMQPHSRLIPTTALSFKDLSRQIARKATEFLGKMIEGNHVPLQATYVKPRLIVRESTIPGADVPVSANRVDSSTSV